MFLSDFRNITQLLNLKPKLMICSPKNIVKKKKRSRKLESAKLQYHYDTSRHWEDGRNVEQLETTGCRYWCVKQATAGLLSHVADYFMHSVTELYTVWSSDE